MPKPPATPDRCVELWIKYHRDHGTVPKSLISYEQDTKRAIKIFAANGRETLPYRWTEADLLWIKKYWESDHIRPDGTRKGPLVVKTVKGYINAISRIAEYYGNDVGKTARIRYQQDMRPNVDWLDFDDAIKVINADMTPFQRAAIHFMLQLAMRRVECIRMKVDMVDFRDNSLNVDGKGHKRRTVFFHRDTDKILAAWMEARSELKREALAFARRTHRKFVDSDALFVWRCGPELRPYSEKGTGFDKQVTNKLSKQLGMKIKNHTLRRTWGREMHYRGNVDILEISLVYGHSNPITTMKYIGMDRKRLAEIMNKVPF